MCRVVSVSYEKNLMLFFNIEPRIRFYTRTREFKNEVTNRRSKKGPILNLKKFCIKNGLRPFIMQEPFIMQDFSRFKNGPFHKRQKKHNLRRLKTEQFRHIFF